MAFIWTKYRSICIIIDPVFSKYTCILSVNYIIMLDVTALNTKKETTPKSAFKGHGKVLTDLM